MESGYWKIGGSKAGFPIIADTDLKVAKAFDMLPSEAHLPEGEHQQILQR